VPAENAIVVLAEFDRDGLLVPGLRGALLKSGEARRLGHAVLRDCVDKAHHCAGFDPLVAYFPPDRRGEAEEAAGLREAWAEPSAGASRGARVEQFLRHLVKERTYRTAIALDPRFPHIARKPIFDAAHTVHGGGALAFAAAEDGTVGLIGVRGEVPLGLGAALETSRPAAALVVAAQRAGMTARQGALPPPVDSEAALAQTVFDLRAEIATGKHAGDDLPLHLLETFDGMGFVASLKGDGSVELRRAGPPKARFD
jgi:hypothetical protein